MTRPLALAATAFCVSISAPVAADTLVTKGLQEAIVRGAPANLLTQPTFRPGGTPIKIEVSGDVVDQGILRCSRKKLGMRVISEECVTRLMPLIQQTDPRIPKELQSSADVGCFDTSVLTVLRTQMAHANEALKPEGRTAMLTQAVGNAGTPPEIAALVMLYRMQSMGQRQRDLVASGFTQVPWASYYRLQEAAPDLNGGRVAEMKGNPPCNPYADVWCTSSFNFSASVEMYWSGDERPNALIDDAYIERRMREGASLVLGYLRYTPRVIGTGTNRRIVFDVGPPHKVVPSGFSTTGKYRLIVNDVGYTGVKTAACNFGEGCLRKRGHLRRDVKTKLAEWGYPDVPIDYPVSTRIIYEEEGDAPGDHTLRFVEFVNSLSVRKKT